MAALLSQSGEKSPNVCWELNLIGVKMIFDLAVEYKLKVFWPSSIACFGPTTPRHNTPQHTINEPTSMYGVTKF
jgi:nucleoside-diphosphate-sugar epimerase